MALLIISLIAIVGIIVLFFVRFHKFRYLGGPNILKKEVLVEYIGYIVLFGIFSVLASLGIILKNHYTLKAGNIVMMIFGSLIFGVSFFAFIECFVFYYYKRDLLPKIKKVVRIIMFAVIPFMVIFFCMAIDSYFITGTNYPIVSGITISGKGITFARYGRAYGDGFTINWYALIMITGALVCYFIVDHRLYKEYKRHGIVDTMFILCFLAGILGARMWYCFVLDRSAKFFDFRSGGLAIQGGVLAGAIVGILYVIFFRKYINLRHAMDIILPTVLIAQAIGRWGNFFNCEVHGNPVNAMGWQFLPSFILDQMRFSSVGADLTGTGQIYLPLFLIESITNLCGYFVIRYAVGEGLKKRTSNGDLFCLYVVWYGLTRVLFEPLRFSTGGGTYKYNESYITAWVMFGGGLAAIIGLHLFDFFRYGKRTFAISKNNFTDPKCPYYVKPLVETSTATPEVKVEVKKDENTQN